MLRTLLIVAAISIMVAAPAPFTHAADDLADPWERRLGAAVTIPEFGGAWVAQEDGEKVLHLWLTRVDAAVEDRVVDALVTARPDRFVAEVVVVHRADYGHSDLVEWARLAAESPHATTSRVDHRENRVAVSVADADRDGPVVTAELAARGVPAEALIFEQLGPISPSILLGESLQEQQKSSWPSPMTLTAVAGLAVGVTAGAVVLWRRVGRD